MDKRILLILCALLLPIIAVVFLAQTPETDPAVKEAAKPKTPEIGAQSKPPGRLPPTLQKASATKEVPPPRRPLTLDEARARLKKEMQRLDGMTQEEWEKEQRERDERRRARQQKERETKETQEKKP